MTVVFYHLDLIYDITDPTLYRTLIWSKRKKILHIFNFKQLNYMYILEQSVLLIYDRFVWRLSSMQEDERLKAVGSPGP